MSSAVVSTSAALGRPFLFDAEPEPEVRPIPGVKRPASTESIAQVVQSKINNQQSTILYVTPASRLEIRPAPEMVTSGVPALDALTGGLPRGCLTEICGTASSGRTSVMLAALATATRRGEYCAVIDATDTLDPHSLAAAGIDLDRLLWIRCGDDIQKPPKGMKSEGAPPLSRTLRQGGGFDFPSQSPFPFQQSKAEAPRPEASATPEKFPRATRPSEHCLEQVLRATDLLLESGGFGLIILDLADISHQSARRIPLTTWFRFRRAVEHKPTILLAIEQQPIAGSCSSLLLQLGTADVPAAKRRKNAAHACPERSRRGASRGLNPQKGQAPEGRHTICETEETPLEFSSPSHANLLTELEIHAELIRSRLDRKPTRSITFETKPAWAG
jgi:hypothetical protein